MPRGISDSWDTQMVHEAYAGILGARHPERCWPAGRRRGLALVFSGKSGAGGEVE